MKTQAGDDAAHPADDAPASFGLLLRYFRLKAGFSQETLAERAHVSSKAVGALEQGARRAPYRDTVDALVRALSLSPPDTETFKRAAENARDRNPRRPVARLAAPRIALPQFLTPFIERSDVDDIAALLERHRLLTITGPGGVGKTRTAVEAASRHALEMNASVMFVDLSSIRDGRLIVDEIASALGTTTLTPKNAQQRLVDELANRNFLLLLDNCEHVVVETANLASDLLKACPTMSILATSRELLGVSNEVVYRLPSLRVPEGPIATLPQALSYPAVALFVRRAQLADPRLVLDVDRIAPVIEICRKLDGIPLAIELAAARLPNVGLQTLSDRLTQLLLVPGRRDLPARQRTMEATISWSYELLDEAEQKLLQRLSLFASSFTIDAAERVCADRTIPLERVAHLLVRLIDKSLVNPATSSAEVRYSLLESIRAYGRAQLEARGELDVASRRHAEWLAAYADYLHSSPIASISNAISDLENARTAINWCLKSNDQAKVALAARIVGGGRRIWFNGGRGAERLRYATEILHKLDDREEHYELIARLWRARLNPPTTVDRELIERATPFLERAGDFEALAVTRSQLAFHLAGLGLISETNDALSLASAFFDAQEPKSKGRAYSAFLGNACAALCAIGEVAKARAMLHTQQQALKDGWIFPDQELHVDNLAAMIEFACGNKELAIAACRRSLEASIRQSYASGVFGSLAMLCQYLLTSRSIAEADRACRSALMYVRAYRTDATPVDVGSMQPLATIAAMRGQTHLAATILGFIDAWYSRCGITPLSLLINREGYKLLKTSLEERLPATELATLRKEGEALSFDDAADLLLQLPSCEDELETAHDSFELGVSCG